MKKLCALILLAITLFACSKKKSNNNVSPQQAIDSVQIIVNANLANVQDSVQAYYTDSLNFKHYFYGSFDATGTPLLVKSQVIQRHDTTINIFYDSSQNVTRMFASVNGTLDTTLISFSYFADSVKLIISSINWSTGTTTTRNITTLTAGNAPQVINTQNFRTTHTTTSFVSFCTMLTQIDTKTAIAAFAVFAAATAAGELAGGPLVGAMAGQLAINLIVSSLNSTTVSGSSGTPPENPDIIIENTPYAYSFWDYFICTINGKSWYASSFNVSQPLDNIYEIDAYSTYYGHISVEVNFNMNTVSTTYYTTDGNYHEAVGTTPYYVKLGSSSITGTFDGLTTTDGLYTIDNGSFSVSLP